MAAVGRGVDEYVIRARLDAALDGGFEVFVFGFGFLKGKVVEEDDEAFAREVAQVLHDGRQVPGAGAS